MTAAWDISAIAAVGILVVAALVRHFRRSFGGGPGGCGGGCSCGAAQPDRERCG